MTLSSTLIYEVQVIVCNYYRDPWVVSGSIRREVGRKDNILQSIWHRSHVPNWPVNDNNHECITGMTKQRWHHCCTIWNVYIRVGLLLLLVLVHNDYCLSSSLELPSSSLAISAKPSVPSLSHPTYVCPNSSHPWLSSERSTLFRCQSTPSQFRSRPSKFQQWGWVCWVGWITESYYGWPQRGESRTYNAYLICFMTF